MSFTVIEADEEHFVVWDGRHDPKHRATKVGITEVYGSHPFKVGDKVNMIFRLVNPVWVDLDKGVEESFVMTVSPDRCEMHNAFHTLGSTCIAKHT